MVCKFRRILDLIPSDDGKIRSAKVQLPDKKTLKRSVTQLYPLECNLDQDNEDNLDDGTDSDPELDGQVDKNCQEFPRIRRKAKNHTKMKILNFLVGVCWHCLRNMMVCKFDFVLC